MFHATNSDNRMDQRPGASKVFLTFDDGPDAVWTPKILEALRRADAKATFFVITPPAWRSPREMEAIQEAGHTIGLHCARHVRHTEMTREDAEADVRSGLRDLAEIGVRPGFWRPPWGVLAPWTEDVAMTFGLTLVPWTADTHDWRGDDADGMLGAISPALGPDAVILMHDGLGPGARRPGCEETVALIGPLVRRIRSLGCEPSAMSLEAVV